MLGPSRNGDVSGRWLLDVSHDLVNILILILVLVCVVVVDVAISIVPDKSDFRGPYFDGLAVRTGGTWYLLGLVFGEGHLVFASVGVP